MRGGGQVGCLSRPPTSHSGPCEHVGRASHMCVCVEAPTVEAEVSLGSSPLSTACLSGSTFQSTDDDYATLLSRFDRRAVGTMGLWVCLVLLIWLRGSGTEGVRKGRKQDR